MEGKRERRGPGIRRRDETEGSVCRVGGRGVGKEAAATPEGKTETEAPPPLKKHDKTHPTLTQRHPSPSTPAELKCLTRPPAGTERANTPPHQGSPRRHGRVPAAIAARESSSHGERDPARANAKRPARPRRWTTFFHTACCLPDV